MEKKTVVCIKRNFGGASSFRKNLIKSKKPKTAILIGSTTHLKRYAYGRDDVYVPKQNVKLEYC